MAISDPFVAYNAGSNVEAHLVCGLLLDAGIKAMAIDDVSQLWVLVAGVQKPQVWIERADIERAQPILTGYERRAAERRAAGQGASGVSGPSIEVLCEECGKRSEFPAAQKGSVQSCPRCGAYVDVGDDRSFDP